MVVCLGATCPPPPPDSRFRFRFACASSAQTLSLRARLAPCLACLAPCLACLAPDMARDGTHAELGAFAEVSTSQTDLVKTLPVLSSHRDASAATSSTSTDLV
eukprot:1031399-Rhodomonas_salina.2